METIPSNICLKHNNKKFKFICYSCSILCCSKCIIKHLNHKCVHVDNIKNSLFNQFNNRDGEFFNNNLNNNSSEDSDENFDNEIKNKIESLWNYIKSSSERYNTLRFKENEIKEHFEKLHKYIIIEEHKLKKPILEDIDSINNNINQSIEELKFLFNTYQQEHYKENKEQHKNEQLNYEEIDTTDKYQIESIIKSVNNSNTLKEFINNNSSTIFNQHLNLTTNSINLLESIYKFNKQYNIIEPKSNEQPTIYTIAINQLETISLKSSINKSIRIRKSNIIDNPSLTSSSSSYNNNDSKDISVDKSKTYIFSLHKSKGVTIIDIFDNRVHDTLTIENFDFTYSSVVSAGEYVYIFGGIGHSHETQYTRYSIKSKSFETSKMTIEGRSSMASCYDGGDYIYLLGGAKSFNSFYRIDRFNIHTKTFELFMDDLHLGLYQSAFIVDNFMYAHSHNSLLTIDINRKEITRKDLILPNSSIFETYKSCADDKGNIYIYSNEKKFKRYNIYIKDTVNLEFIPKLQGCISSLIYCTVNHYIYALNGKEFGNYYYSVKDDKWNQFYIYDDHNRINFSSCIYSV